MGWDIHFCNTRKIGEILTDEEFSIDFEKDGAYIFTVDEEGKKSGLFFPGITEENYKDEYLTYGFISYGSRLGEFLWKLYNKYDMWFADTALEDFWYLSGDCENEEEEDALLQFCYAEEMVHFFGDNLPEDDKMRKILKETEPIRNKIYDRYKERVEKLKKDVPVDNKTYGEEPPF